MSIGRGKEYCKLDTVSFGGGLTNVTVECREAIGALFSCFALCQGSILNGHPLLFILIIHWDVNQCKILSFQMKTSRNI